MNSPPYGSDPRVAFELLHRDIQRWIYREGWQSLRSIQADAINALQIQGRDLLIAAPTAAGKTEAAFLPLISRMLGEEADSVRILYIGPLKALINDQFLRLELLCRDLGIPVHRWHGDVSDSKKRSIRHDPSGIVLITPESLEALFVNHGARIPRMFACLEGIVIDETHSFIGNERGAQVQSLLHRLESAIQKRVDRVGLSATLGNPRLAADFLRAGHGVDVTLVESTDSSSGLKAIIKGFYRVKPDSAELTGFDAVANHVYSKMRGSNNLIFANSRKDVEDLGDKLVQRCKFDHVPIEFAVHHGSLSKDIREDTEARLKEGSPISVVCTSTLEMGIDIGNVRSVAQVGVPSSVASLRQRVGRSGRRDGDFQILWMYGIEDVVDSNSHLDQRLRVSLVQQSAMLGLLSDGWCESPVNSALHLSTLVQQSLSAVAGRGGMHPASLYRLLCSGPFSQISKSTFSTFLRQMGEKGVLTSAEDGVLLAGVLGEKMLAHYSFYASFSSGDEYRIVCGSNTLGTVPISEPIHSEGFIIFAARRWKVLEVDEDAKVVLVAASSSGNVPKFGGNGFFGTRKQIRDRMRDLYSSNDDPPFLDEGASRFLAEGREEFNRLGLGSRRFIFHGKNTTCFLWDSDYAALTLSLALKCLGVESHGDGLCLTFPGVPEEEVNRALRSLHDAQDFPAAHLLAEQVANKVVEKHDPLLGDALLNLEYSSKYLDIPAARSLLATFF